MKPPLIKQLDLEMSDKSPAVRLACRIVLGRELHHLKQDRGSEGGGTYHAFRDKFKPGERLTWQQYCLAQAGISEISARLYYQCGEAVMTRLRCLQRPGWKELHRKLEKQPSKMTAAERADMIGKIIILGLTKGETQGQLVREYQGVHLPPPELKMNYAKIEESREARQCPPSANPARATEVTRKVELARLAMVALREINRRRELKMEPPYGLGNFFR